VVRLSQHHDAGRRKPGLGQRQQRGFPCAGNPGQFNANPPSGIHARAPYQYSERFTAYVVVGSRHRGSVKGRIYLCRRACMGIVVTLS
jgi:hypothetical protein